MQEELNGDNSMWSATILTLLLGGGATKELVEDMEAPLLICLTN